MRPSRWPASIRRTTWRIEDSRHVCQLQELGRQLAGAGEPGSGHRYRLYDCYPNLCDGPPSISFELPVSGTINLQILDAEGRLVRRLIDAQLFEAGRHAVPRSGRNNAGRPVAAGVYFYRLDAGGHFRG